VADCVHLLPYELTDNYSQQWNIEELFPFLLISMCLQLHHVRKTPVVTSGPSPGTPL
jgi:hypothetical protein